MKVIQKFTQRNETSVIGLTVSIRMKKNNFISTILANESSMLLNISIAMHFGVVYS